MRSEMEAKLNAPSQRESIKPVRWKDVIKEYLDKTYAGHDLPTKERKSKEKDWKKSSGTFKRENLAIRCFERLCKPDWCHELTSKDRDRFVTGRLDEVGSPATVDAELRALHALVEVMEEWVYRTKGENPFAGKAKVEGRRRRKEQAQDKAEKHYGFEEVKTLLTLATKEAQDSSTVEKKRLRVLVYFVAYTGCRINEAIHLEWQDIDFEKGIAWLYFKVENDLKTEGSQAPFSLPERLLAALREWKDDNDRIDCSWVFANSRKKPWKGGVPGYRPFDQMQALGKRAGIEGLTSSGSVTR
jgi:integrase